ncbi:hypothetical protein, partial [Streptomyces alboviridis]|uniref:hypothetical protein n=1 Tax=Streptomyces alboviridis TaxID=67269 RepID=UPI001F383161
SVQLTSAFSNGCYAAATYASPSTEQKRDQARYLLQGPQKSCATSNTYCCTCPTLTLFNGTVRRTFQLR